ncbi:MAG: DUF1501 domain-containing protein [Betaproteobacteria bacterium]|nr:DUF1501 domain-containing protein [Betaproteobacteria bacterium]
MKRREFLSRTAMSAAALCLPGAVFAQAESAYRRLLVLVELKGGNDGLNTVVPYADDAYYSLRPQLAVKRDQVLQLDQRTGLHPAMQALMPLWQARELALVQGVGYPEPNLSHFRSIEIWDTASKSGETLSDGWLARAFAMRPAPVSFAADGVVVGGNDMGPLAGIHTRAVALTDTESFLRQARLANPAGKARNGALAHILRVEADVVQAAANLNADYAFRTEFPRNPFGQAVRTAAQIAANPAGVAVIRLSLGGFDTHRNQPAVHERLLGELSGGIAALKSALTEIGKWDSTLVMTYAEFGRRPQENGSMGTDHGTANAHFLAGGRVRGGLYGVPPDLTALDGGNLRFSIDYRNLYATLLERWWGVESARVLNGQFAALDVVRA